MSDVAAIGAARPPIPSLRSVRDVTVLGLGNILLSDDGVGVHVARSLALNPGSPQGLRALDGGTLGFRLLDALTRSDSVLIVDAALLGEQAGAMRLLESEELHDHVSRTGRMSAHEAGLADLLTLARLEGWAPKHLALLGVQPEIIDWGEALSEKVAQAVPAACRKVTEKALSWLASA